MDISERAGANLTITWLDWKMAFGKVHQTNILQVLGRLRVPPRMLKLIQRIFSNPIAKFRVLAEGRHSESMTQNSGIGQGCPLSQFLFLFLMSAMFTDIKSRLNTPKQQEPTRGINYRNWLQKLCTLMTPLSSAITQNTWTFYCGNPKRVELLQHGIKPWQMLQFDLKQTSILY